jgi:hypothetical protein
LGRTEESEGRTEGGLSGSRWRLLGWTEGFERRLLGRRGLRGACWGGLRGRRCAQDTRGGWEAESDAESRRGLSCLALTLMCVFCALVMPCSRCRSTAAMARSRCAAEEVTCARCME